MKPRAEIFEAVFNINIEDFSTTEEIDEFVQKRCGRGELKTEEIITNVVLNRGSIVPVEKIELNEMIDDILAS